MKRYKFGINSSLVPTISRINETMNNFGFNGHAIGWRIGTIESNIVEGQTVESTKALLENAINECMQDKKMENIWLVAIEEVAYV